MRNMTKEKFHTTAKYLILTTLLSTIVCLFVNSYLPLIITALITIVFIIVVKNKYNYKIIENIRPLTETEEAELSETALGNLTGHLSVGYLFRNVSNSKDDD